MHTQRTYEYICTKEAHADVSCCCTARNRAAVNSSAYMFQITYEMAHAGTLLWHVLACAFLKVGPDLNSSRRMAPRMNLLPLICSLRGETRTVIASKGMCMASGVTDAVTLLDSFRAIAWESSGCSLASPYLRMHVRRSALHAHACTIPTHARASPWHAHAC